jgi:hypothetical protein
MLTATLIVSIITLVRRWLRRSTTATTTTSSADQRRSRSAGSSRWSNIRRPVPVSATLVTLVGIAIAASALVEC